MPTARPAPAENLAAILRWLTHALVTRGLTGQLSQRLVSLIVDRLRGINQRFARIAARVSAGRYAPRRYAPHRSGPRHPAVAPRPRQPDPLPRSHGWLQAFVPEAACARAQLEHLLRDPEMVALLAAAPVSLARPLRSLCRMLRVDPPPGLPAPRPAPASPPAQAMLPTSQTTSQTPPPALAARAGSPRRPSPPRACGPPRPA